MSEMGELLESGDGNRRHMEENVEIRELKSGKRYLISLYFVV